MSSLTIDRTGGARAPAWLAVLGMLAAACSHPAKLPYDLSGLGNDGTCGERSPGCDGLTPAGRAPAATKPSAPVASAAPPGGVRLVVSLTQQRLFVYRDGALVATSPVSTGKRGHATPVGTFRILEKRVHHRSNRYSNAPMPYMERLTESGIALHAGHLPGYPASHGCIRMPLAFAKRLYRMTNFRSVVTVTRARVKTRRGTAVAPAPREASPASSDAPLG